MSKMEVPEAWELKTIRDILKDEKFAVVDGPFGTQLHVSDYVQKGIPLIRIKNILWNKQMDLNGIVYITEEKFQELKRSAVFPNDILIAKTGGTIGKVCLFPPHIEKGLIASSCAKISVDPELADISYVLYFLSSHHGQSQIIESSNGGTRNAINNDSIRNLAIPLPSLLIQKKIVKKLNNILEELNKKLLLILNTYETQLKLNKKQKQTCYQSILNSATFGKFSVEWREKHLKTKISDEIFQFHDPSLLKKETLSKIPKTWAIVPLSSISDIRGGVTLGRKLSGKLISLPYLRVANVQDGFLDLRKIKEIQIKLEEKEKWQLKNNDLLLTEGGDWDKLGRGTLWKNEIPNCIHQNHIFRVRMGFLEINPSFISHIIASTYGKKFFQESSKQTTNLASINSTQLKGFPVLLPPLEEQNEIEKIINEKLNFIKIIESHTNDYSLKVQKSQKYIQFLSTSILDKAFTGQLLN